MKKILFSIVFTIISVTTFAQVGVGTTTPDASAALDIESTTKGLLAPRMDDTAMNAIASPATGLVVYNTTNSAFYYYTGAAWVQLISTGANLDMGANGITTNGNLTIGTALGSIRTGYQLDLQESANNGVNIQAGNSSTDVALSVGSAATADKFVVQAGGNVGIGVATPDSDLHVLSGDGAGEITSTGGTTLTLESDASNYLSILSPDASLKGLLFGNPSNALHGGVFYQATTNLMQFRTSGNSTKMVINGNNVGIGTTSPNANLELKGSNTNLARFTQTDPAYTGTVLKSGTTKSASSDFALMRLNTEMAADGTGGTTHFYVRGDGNIGIGKTSPNAKLDVAGEIRIYPTTGTGVLRFGEGTTEKGKISVTTDSDMVIETGGQTRATINASGLDMGALGITTTGEVNAGEIVNKGATFNSYIGNNGLDFSFNRNPSTGVISSNTGYSYQLHRNPSVTASSDNLSWQVYSTTGALVESNALVIDGNANIGIGISSPSEKLEVDGTIKATDINFSGLSTYADDAAAGVGGLVAGDVYKTATGELRIKL